MIKINRVDSERTEKAKEVLMREKARNGDYNQLEVNIALKEVFHGKCYICENKAVTSYQIEHLIPHKDNVDLKFDWKNLFWACAHCNNTKGNKFTPILNCNEVEVEKKIAFRKVGYFGTDEKYCFSIVDDDTEEVRNTIALLNAVYYGNTAQKELEALNIRRTLRKDISEFKEYIREYCEEVEGVEKEDLKCCIEKELKENSSFTAFKRWIIWDNAEKFPEFVEFLDSL